MVLPIKHKSFFAISLMMLLISVIWVWTTRVDVDLTTGGRIPAPHTGFLAPNFRLEAASGESIQLSELRGKPVIINLWASWCGPCRAEMPAIQRVFDRYQKQGLIVLAVNMTSQDSVTNALAFAADHNLTFPILFDHDGTVARLYENRALPTTFFVDRQGVIQEVVIGGPMAEALLSTRVLNLLTQEGR